MRVWCTKFVLHECHNSGRWEFALDHVEAGTRILYTTHASFTFAFSLLHIYLLLFIEEHGSFVFTTRKCTVTLKKGCLVSGAHSIRQELDLFSCPQEHEFCTPHMHLSHSLSRCCTFTFYFSSTNMILSFSRHGNV